MGSSESKSEEVGQIYPSINSFGFNNLLSGVAPFPSFDGPQGFEKETENIVVISQVDNTAADGSPVEQPHGEQVNPVKSEKYNQVEARKKLSGS